MKYNVDRLKLIQLGLTLSTPDASTCLTWQFNFSDFNSHTDASSPSSIALLKDSSIDFLKFKQDGIPSNLFAHKFLPLLTTLPTHKVLKWVTFHGMYDLACLLKVLINQFPLPESKQGFSALSAKVFSNVYDVKFMAKYCKGLMDGELGLEKLSNLLGVERLGEFHRAGPDSLLTARAFAKLKQTFGIEEAWFDGFLYGFNKFKVGALRASPPGV